MTTQSDRQKSMFQKPLITVFAFTVFILITVMMLTGVVNSFDESILLAMRTAGDLNDPIGPPWFEETAADITALGGYPIITLVTGLFVLALLLGRKVAEAIYTVATLAVGSIASTLLKLFFARPRPDLVEHADRVFTSSFPSAHAMMSTIAWLTFALMAAHLLKGRNLRSFLLLAAIFIITLVGASRIYLGVHWPSDVLAGWAAGTAWVTFCWMLARRMKLIREPSAF